MIKCIIVDDEQKSRESLRILVNDFCEGVDVVALCENNAQAKKAIESEEPDVVFLDIQLQRETGFDLFAIVNEINFDVIFTTAYSEFAVKAFKFSAIDYLLKPIDIMDLKGALGKVEKKRKKNQTSHIEYLIQNLKSVSNEQYKLALPTQDGLIFVSLHDILYCEANSNYTEITTRGDKKYVASKTLKEYDDLLADYNFYRIHNSALVNLHAVKKYVRGDGGYVIMNNDKALDVSKRRKEGFISKISALI